MNRQLMRSVIYGIKQKLLQQRKMYNSETASSTEVSQPPLLTKCPLGGLSKREMFTLNVSFHFI